MTTEHSRFACSTSGIVASKNGGSVSLTTLRTWLTAQLRTGPRHTQKYVCGSERAREKAVIGQPKNDGWLRPEPYDFPNHDFPRIPGTMGPCAGAGMGVVALCDWNLITSAFYLYFMEFQYNVQKKKKSTVLCAFYQIIPSNLNDRSCTKIGCPWSHFHFTNKETGAERDGFKECQRDNETVSPQIFLTTELWLSPLAISWLSLEWKHWSVWVWERGADQPQRIRKLACLLCKSAYRPWVWLCLNYLLSCSRSLWLASVSWHLNSSSHFRIISFSPSSQLHMQLGAKLFCVHSRGTLNCRDKVLSSLTCRALNQPAVF